MDFRDYKTFEELQQKTGLTVREAIELLDAEIEKLKGDK